jgi:hypothetical protein
MATVMLHIRQIAGFAGSPVPRPPFLTDNDLIGIAAALVLTSM